MAQLIINRYNLIGPKAHKAKSRGLLAQLNWTCGQGKCHQRLTTAAMFLRSCVAHALSRGVV